MTATVRVAELRHGLSPRKARLDLDHASRLSQVWDQLPPILVHGESMKIVDGEHRKAAAQQLGLAEVEVEWFDGTEAAALDEATRRNVTHGLPLTIAERRTQAARMLSVHPEWSSAWIAELSGLAANTVEGLRSTSQRERLNKRTGRDGRQRPTSTAAVPTREKAAEIISERPTAPLRDVARESGASLGTVHDVKQRVERGDAPVPPRLQPVPEPVGEGVRVDEVVTFVPKWASDPEFQAGNAVRAFGEWMQRRTTPHPTSGSRVDYTVWLEGVDLDACPPQHREVAAGELQRIAGYLTRAADELSSPSKMRSMR